MTTHRSVVVAQALLDEAVERKGMRTNGPLRVSVPADILYALILIAGTPYPDIEWKERQYEMLD